MDTQAFGRRVAFWRERRQLTQVDFARLMEQSRRWVQELEGGRRQSDPQLSVIERAARVLKVRMEVLLTDSPVTACIDAAELDAIRTTLQRHDVITGTADDDGTTPLSVERLWSGLLHARSAFEAGRYGSLGTAVPKLLIDTNRAAARHDGDERLAAFRVLAMTLNLAESASIKFGAPDLALVSGHRAVAAAERSEDPVIMGLAACHLSDAMTHSGQAPAATSFAVAAAGRLTPDLLTSGADGLSVLGTLYLKAAMAQANAAEAAADTRAAASVPVYLDQADEHVARLGDETEPSSFGPRTWTSFGPTNNRLYRVAAAVQLSEGGDAVAVAEGIPAPDRAALPRERRAHHLVDLARAYQQAGRREKAVDTLLEAEREAEEEVRCRPRTRQLVEDLRLLGVGSAEGRLQALAGRCGLTG
ncbi:helix-turn-helix transcriptional regulator [Streptomyces scabiei]|uniref:helix-turn-helix domain-containing protein n=1 Tax=Streptomyces scabiei TaxID=1930 RepID=UPI0029A1047D|nr:helix-turn-helix transcriptional regulator [Streptomyces scabiei]MDX3165996.1 helix-turn-helix transcriptional regulator [Streptomyces scabiei]